MFDVSGKHIEKCFGMRVLVYFGHPAQYLFLRATIRYLLNNDCQVKIVIKSKDVLENLLLSDDMVFSNIQVNERGETKIAILISLLKRGIKLMPIIAKFKPDVLIGTDAIISQLGWILRIDRITITEDDYEVVRHLAWLSYPFTQTILCPIPCNVGRWESKKVGYNGFMKLGYLHPNVFTSSSNVLTKYKIKENYVILRLAKLTAHHDFGVLGIQSTLLDELIELFESYGLNVFISAEGSTEDKYTRHLIDLDPQDMHQFLANSKLLICDSQSMSVEACMLGVPSIRVSSFVGKISVLEELEHKYGLTYGVSPEMPERVLEITNELLAIKNLKKLFQERRMQMLKEKIDVTHFLTEFIMGYPDSAKILRNHDNMD